jgi:predicted Zn-ribbon and HTH transcriptional regulator
MEGLKKDDIVEVTGSTSSDGRYAVKNVNPCGEIDIITGAWCWDCGVKDTTINAVRPGSRCRECDGELRDRERTGLDAMAQAVKKGGG